MIWVYYAEKLQTFLGHIVIAQWAEVRKNTNLNLKETVLYFDEYTFYHKDFLMREEQTLISLILKW